MLQNYPFPQLEGSAKTSSSKMVHPYISTLLCDNHWMPSYVQFLNWKLPL